MTRIATSENEAALLDFAQGATAAHVERLAGAWRRVDAVAAARAEARHQHRHLSTWVDDDGMLVIRGRLTPEVGAVVQRALEAASDQLFRQAQGAPKAGRLGDEVTPGQRRADALGLLAEVALTGDPSRGTAGDRYQVVLHVEASGVAAGEGLSGTLEADHSAVDVSAETSRRVACDASLVEMHHGDGGAVLDVGRKTRTVPPSIRRALQARDGSCRFPGCTARRCDAHHVEHWIDGGVTNLENLVLLCRRHHRAVHERGFGLITGTDGRMTFLRPNGTVLETAPALSVTVGRNEPIPVADRLPVWDGTPFDIVYAIDVLYAPRGPSAPARSGSRSDQRAEADRSPVALCRPAYHAAASSRIRIKPRVNGLP